MIQINGNIDELCTLTKGITLAEPTLKKATVSATNKSIVSIRTFGVREVAREYKLTQKTVRSELIIVRAHIRRIEAKIIGDGSPGIPLYKFSPTPKRSPSTRRLKSGGYSPKKGIKVMIHRGQRKTVKDAFIARMDSGHVGVFKRRINTKRIDELFGPSPIRILDSNFYKNKIDDFAEVTMNKNMAHEAEFYLKRAGILPSV